jgi:hypothetical protein
MGLRQGFVCVAIALLCACGSTSAPPGPGGSPSVASKTVDPCVLLPKAALDTAFGETFTQDHGTTATHCYSHGQGTEIDLDYGKSGAADAMRIYKSTHVSDVAVPGLGDEAYFEAAADDIQVRKGDRWFEIALTQHKAMTPEMLQGNLTKLATTALAAI